MSFPLTDREFAEVRELIARTVGIQLGDTKRALVIARLAPRLRELGLGSFSPYLDLVTDGAHADELRVFVDSLCTNETSFFREGWQFEHLEKVIVPRWKLAHKAGLRDRRVRVWSAACSTGDEPYSVAMLLGHHLPQREGWKVEVLATDISSRVLRQAQEGVWNLERSKNIPSIYLRAFMLRGVGEREGTMKAAPELQSMIRFAPLNLQSDAYPSQAFDVILCRNVLIYFDARARRTIIDKLLTCLVPDGHLFVGHAEAIMGRADQLRTVAPSVYTLSEAQRPVRSLAR